MTKKKKRKRSERSEENKRKWAEKREREAAERKAAKKKVVKKKAIKKPAVEKSDVETKPWPRAGDNKEFEEILDRIEPIETKDQAAKSQAAESKEPEDAVLKTSDVAEWVKWPFELWSTSQDLPPIIKSAEALEIAEPLTRIMNRHGISDYIPPDVIDGMQVVGRTIPVVKRGNDFVKKARKYREAQGKPAAAAKPAPQGAAASKPIEVGGG